MNIEAGTCTCILVLSVGQAVDWSDTEVCRTN